MSKATNPQNLDNEAGGGFFARYTFRLTRALCQRVSNLAYKIYAKWHSKGKVKYFCIGMNKTGTTSLKFLFEDLGFHVGDQRKAEILTGKFYLDQNFKPIIDYCQSAQVFQDIPFSYPDTYKYLDKAYPNSKFILTVRNDSEQWYNSVIQFHAKLFGSDGRIPTGNDLKKVK